MICFLNISIFLQKRDVVYAGDLNSDTLSTIFMEVDPINLGITSRFKLESNH